MIEPKIITKDNLFDLDLTADDIRQDNTGETLITTRLFTQSWWGNPDGGSRFEDVSGGIITNNTRQNISAVLDEISKDLNLDDLKFDVGLSAYNIKIRAKWRDGDTVITSGI